MAQDSVTSPASTKVLITIMVKSKAMGESDTDGKRLPWTPVQEDREHHVLFAYVFLFLSAGVCVCVHTRAHMRVVINSYLSLWKTKQKNLSGLCEFHHPTSSWEEILSVSLHIPWLFPKPQGNEWGLVHWPGKPCSEYKHTLIEGQRQKRNPSKAAEACTCQYRITVSLRLRSLQHSIQIQLDLREGESQNVPASRHSVNRLIGFIFTDADTAAQKDYLAGPRWQSNFVRKWLHSSF